VRAPVRPKLVYLVTEDWFFASHFLGFARAAYAAGCEPIVVARVRAHRAAIEATGARVIPVEADRRATGPAALMSTIARYRGILRDESPAIVHCIALKPVMLGGLAARLASVPAMVLAPTGLGYLWVNDGLKAKLGRAAVRSAVAALNGPRTRFLFENRDDPAVFGLDPDDAGKVTIVSGAGVAPDDYPVQPLPTPGPLRVAVVARMLRSKGIEEAVEAVRLARADGAEVTLDLWGEPDADNPGAVSRENLERWSREPGIAWRGRSDRVQDVWRHADVAMLLSHGGEGLPRTLVEAAASGRPIVTTDVPGCRDVVTDGVEGRRVPPRDAPAAARALVDLAAAPDLRERMGRAARARFERDMTAAAVNGRVEQLYRSLLAGLPTRI
jgi:glycosyltransferase involved in cell wall biosynthesis